MPTFDERFRQYGFNRIQPGALKGEGRGNGAGGMGESGVWMERVSEAGRIIVQEVVEWLEDPGCLKRDWNAGASQDVSLCSRNVITLCDPSPLHRPVSCTWQDSILRC